MGKQPRLEKRKPVGVTHGGLIKETVALLNTIGLYAWKNQTGGYKRGGVWIKYGHDGSPDIICVCPGGKMIWIEVKVGRDYVKPAQEKFRDRVESLGHAYVVISASDDLLVLNADIRSGRIFRR